MSKKCSEHILSTSSNLLGFCLVVITSFKISGLSSKTYVDEFTEVATVILVVCCILSFLSIRNSDKPSGARYETIADYLFVFCLIIILVVTIMIAFIAIEA